PMGKKAFTKTEIKVEQVPVSYTNLKNYDINRTYKGFDLVTGVKLGLSEELASVMKKDGENYFAKYSLEVKLPRAAQTLEELEIATPSLSKILPGIPTMLEDAEVSDFYHSVYRNKVDRLKKSLTQLDTLLTTHNLFDTQTILNLTHPETGRKILLAQSEMDVVTDGSDGDRLPVMPLENVQSPYYQYSTSWWWKKVTDRKNPMIDGFKHRIGNANREIASGEASPERVEWLEERKEMLNRQIEEASVHSFLLAEYDPFIVMPTQMIVDREDSHSPRAGDYAAVIYRDTIYPCIVGDAGPTYKMGEASLRMAKQLNEKANKNSRPVSDLTVTYIVFSQSRG
ncbi:MAG: glycoside hydrolase family 75 protein, partial [Verrucomicrobiota bacterium]